MNGELKEGTRVCSRLHANYYRIPGKIVEPATLQFDSRPGTEYIVELDSGKRVVFHQDDLDTPTPEEVEKYAEQLRREEENERRVAEKNRRKAEAREQSKANRAAQLEQEQEAKRAEQEAKRQENNEQQRRLHAAEYGRQSLTR